MAVERLRLTVADEGGGARVRWPVTQGVPFADGKLKRGAPVRLVTAAGETLPAQAQCLATWGPDLKYVKWLLIDFQIDLEAGETREIFLEYGADVEVSEPREQIRVERKQGRIRVDTGPMQVDFRTDDADFFAGCRIRTGDGWRDVFRGRPGPYLYMVDQEGGWYDSHSAASPPRIDVEEEGPVRTVVLVRGFHTSQEGHRFCPYVLRLHFCAGRSEIRCLHTFIFDQDPERIELSEIAWRFPFDLGGGLRLAFGGEEKAHWARRFDEGQLLQTSDLAYAATLDGESFGQGERTNGWASLCGRDASVLVVLRDMWKEYPKAIGLNGDGVNVQIWPSESGETLKFSTPFKETAVRFGGTRDEAEFKRLVEQEPTAPLNLKSLNATTREDLEWVAKMVARHAPGRPASYNDTGTNNGLGAARTTEFLLHFAADPVDDSEAERLAVCAQEPLIAPADPHYACATGALRLLAPFDAQRFSEAEEGLDDLFERIVVEPRTKLRAYGMIDYGDLMCSHSGSPAALWTLVKDGDEAIEEMKYCARSYNNESNDQLNALWGFFVHTGARKYFLAAEAYGRHMADIDIVHGPLHSGRVGQIHYHNCHHWSGGPSPSHTCIAGLMLQYYLTGNRRIFDVCREVADWALSEQEPCGILRNRNGALVREYTTPIANLLEYYQATWEWRYGELARRSLKWLLLACPEPGRMPMSVYTAGARGDEAEVEQDGWHLRQAGGMTPQLLYDAVHLFGEDPIYRNALVGMARRYVFHRNDVFEILKVGPREIEQLDPYFNAAIVAYAYAFTDDPIYAAYCRYYVRQHFPERARQMSFTYVCWGSIVPPLMEAVRRAEVEYGTERMDELEREWIGRVEKREEEEGGTRAGHSRPERRSIGIVEGYA